MAQNTVFCNKVADQSGVFFNKIILVNRWWTNRIQQNISLKMTVSGCFLDCELFHLEQTIVGRWFFLLKCSFFFGYPFVHFFFGKIISFSLADEFHHHQRSGFWWVWKAFSYGCIYPPQNALRNFQEIHCWLDKMINKRNIKKQLKKHNKP